MSSRTGRDAVRAYPKGRAVDDGALQDVRCLVGPAPRRELLIEYLHRLQDRHGHLSAAHLAALARELKLSAAEVHEVASFYHHFDVVREDEAAPPALTVRVCGSLSCRMAGAAELLERLPAILGTQVRVVEAPCVGRCENAPSAVVGRHPVDRASVDTVKAAVDAGRTEAEPPPHLDLDAYLQGGGYALLGACRDGSRSLDSVLDDLEQSGLRGMGGAGFPAARKWRIVRAQPAPRLLAVNLDEGEPGTFKDRTFLERDPHRFLEGVLIAAWAVDAAEVYIYLRDEYAGCRQVLAAELEKLAARPPAPLPAIHLRRGAGAYVCGEESAMLESIEGRRGMPRLRPPYVAEVGLFGRPTLVHNMETLYWLRDILEQGPAFHAGHGRRGRRGLRSFSVSGRVCKPGVHRAPAGISVRELIDEYCGGMLPGHELYAYLPGGASGGILPASLADLPLDFDTLQEHGCFIGSAAVMVLSGQDRAVDAARNFTRFFVDESCGQCTPCRVGTAKLEQLIETDRWDADLIRDLAATMADASICGLGQAAPNPVLSVLKHFAHELEEE